MKCAAPDKTLVVLFAEVQGKTYGKTLDDVEAEALVDTLWEALSEEVVKRTADTLTCVKAEAPVKTGNIAVAGVKAYTIVNIVKELESQARVYTQAYTFPQANARSVTNTLACYYRYGRRH